MSSGAGSSADQQLVAVYDSLFVNNCCGIATTVLLAYEYLVTFDREVNLFWRRRFTGASVLFLLNRYLPLSVTILEACGFIKMSDRSCSMWIFAEQTLYLLQYPLWAVMAALRAFALSGRRWPISTIILLLMLVPLGINIADYWYRHSVNDPVLGCAAYLDQPAALTEQLSIAVRSCLIAGDCLVLVVTWHATYRTVRLHLASSGGASFTTTILRDGTVYFLVLLILNVLHLSFNTLSFGNDALTSVSYVTIFTDPITAVLWNRLLMNLQQVNQSIVVDQDSNTVMSTFPGETTLSFARVIGSFGSSVMLSAVEEEEERVIGDSNTAVKQGDEGGRGGLGIEMASIEH